VGFAAITLCVASQRVFVVVVVYFVIASVRKLLDIRSYMDVRKKGIEFSHSEKVKIYTKTNDDVHEVPFEKLIFAQLVKKFFAFSGSRRCITVFKKKKSAIVP
jgi:hypothetical protein